ncbi:MAG: GNAT family N-acetyltransferase [Bacteroidetes bacterium]|nr:GNAT family N-acetyltransferase [Bacteroidota bacterium]
MSIRFLQREDIDTEQWDTRVEQSSPSLSYAKSWYLDAMCAGQWHALVLDDYRAVMPLPYKKKWGIHYLSQPAFTQQVGVFGRCSEEEYRLFLQAIPKKYRLADLQVHTGTPAHLPGLKRRTTYWLNLNSSYESLAAAYRKDARKNLRKLREQSGPYALVQQVDYALHIANYRAVYGALNPGLGEEEYRRFYHALQAAEAHQCLEALQLNDHAGKPLALGLFLKSKKQLHYVMGAPVPGADSGGVHGLIDALIQKYAGTAMTLDFEGSEIPSVAYFYAKFGAVPVHYYALRLNRLPFWLRMLKR